MDSLQISRTTCISLSILLPLIPLSLQGNDSKPVKIFLMVGQSNMQGYGTIGSLKDPKGNAIKPKNGTLEEIISNDSKGVYSFVGKGNGEWIERKDKHSLLAKWCSVSIASSEQEDVSASL